MAASRVEIRGLREFQRELRKADASSANEMRKVHRKVSDMVGDRARASMAAGGRQSAKATRAVKSRSTSKSAYLDTVAKPPFALGTIWGQKRRSGWYAAQRYGASTARQFPEWVGNQWDPGETGSFGSSPYHIGPAIDASINEVLDIYMDGIDDLTRRAFPS